MFFSRHVPIAGDEHPYQDLRGKQGSGALMAIWSLEPEVGASCSGERDGRRKKGEVNGLDGSTSAVGAQPPSTDAEETLHRADPIGATEAGSFAVSFR